MFWWNVPVGLCRSGSDEAYEEKNHLLDGLVELYTDEQEEKTSVAATKKKDADKAERTGLLDLQIRQDPTTFPERATAGNSPQAFLFPSPASQ